MLKHMKRRVIFAAMLAFFAVIVMLAVLVNVVNYCVVTNRLDGTLSSILSFEEKPQDGPKPGGPPPEPFKMFPDEESNYMTRFFVVSFDAAGNAVNSSTDFIASVGAEDAEQLAKQAMSRRSDHGYINEFRYAGPKPDTKEAAIVMLADTIEAAVRSLKNPTPKEIDQFIVRLIRGKLEDGQLSESPLSLHDIDEICEAFSDILKGVYHERIEYPTVPHYAQAAAPVQESAKEQPPASEMKSAEASEEPASETLEETPPQEPSGNPAGEEKEISAEEQASADAENVQDGAQQE